MESIGEALRNARLEKGFTFEQIENDTKIQRRYLEAMENEQWEILPGQVYLKSFFRIYSRYVGISETYYYQLMNEQIARPVPKHHAKKINIKVSSQVKTRIILTLVAVFLLVGTSYFYKQYLALPEIPEVSENTPEIAEPGQDEVVLPGTDETGQNEPTDEPVTIEAMNLALKCINSPCWVRIKDGNNQTLFEGTMNVDQEKQFENLQKFSIRLGNAKSMQVMINGKDFGPLGEMVANKTFFLENNEVKELENQPKESEEPESSSSKHEQTSPPTVKPEQPENPVQTEEPLQSETPEQPGTPEQSEQPEQPGEETDIPEGPTQSEEQGSPGPINEQASGLG